EEVALVQDPDGRPLVGPDLAEHAVDDPRLLGPARLRDVDHVEEEVRGADLLERALERLDQLVGQLVDEADRVGEEDDEAFRKAEPPDGRVERREEPILDHDARLREAVHQRRLAGVRVADERDGRKRDGRALVAVDVPGPLDVLEPARQLRDPLADAPAIDFELRLPRSARPDAAAEAREVRPLPREPRPEILELRELDLHLALEAPRALREDVEDQRAPVDDLAD